MIKTKNIEQSTITLEAFDSQEEIELLKSWFSEPHVSRFWGNPEKNVADACRRDPKYQALIVANGAPIGYICWQTPTRKELHDAGLYDLPPGLVDIDILIGNHKYTGHGIGPHALSILTGQFKDQGIPYAGLGTSIHNRSAIRAYDKAGFKVFREFWEAESGSCLYLIMDLKASNKSL